MGSDHLFLSGEQDSTLESWEPERRPGGFRRPPGTWTRRRGGGPEERALSLSLKTESRSGRPGGVSRSNGRDGHLLVRNRGQRVWGMSHRRLTGVTPGEGPTGRTRGSGSGGSRVREPPGTVDLSTVTPSQEKTTDTKQNTRNPTGTGTILPQSLVFISESVHSETPCTGELGRYVDPSRGRSCELVRGMEEARP